MKKTNTTTRNKRLLRYGASALILTILFVFVFAGALTASFAVEENAIENGLIDANVAEAATDVALSSLNINSTFVYANFTHTGYGSIGQNNNQEG